MPEKKFDYGPIEPAHPMLVRLQDDLFNIYTHIRKNFQSKIDKAFDHVSQQIGFVVATALPFRFETDKNGSIKGGVIIEGKQFQGSLFDKEITATITKLMDSNPLPSVSVGVYRVYFFWYEALKLRLRTEWMEPAHFRYHIKDIHKHKISPYAKPGVIWESHEPAHWFDPGIAIDTEESILIAVIDEVYPEMRLLDRINAIRETTRVRPEVQEPAHYRPIKPEITGVDTRNLLKEMATLLRRFGY